MQPPSLAAARGAVPLPAPCRSRGTPAVRAALHTRGRRRVLRRSRRTAALLHCAAAVWHGCGRGADVAACSAVALCQLQHSKRGLRAESGSRSCGSAARDASSCGSALQARRESRLASSRRARRTSSTATSRSARRTARQPQPQQTSQKPAPRPGPRNWTPVCPHLCHTCLSHTCLSHHHHHHHPYPRESCACPSAAPLRVDPIPALLYLLCPYLLPAPAYPRLRILLHLLHAHLPRLSAPL